MRRASWWSLRRPLVTHPTVLVLAAAAAVVGALVARTLLTPAGALAFLAGLALFVPQEYVTHRFVLHRPPSRVRLLRAMQERLHFRHHDEPSDLRFVFAPLWGVLPIAAAYYGLYWLVLRDAALAGCVSFAGLVAYVLYEHAHYVAHSPIVPRTRWGKRVKAAHLLHHHKNEFNWFGVTTNVADAAVGTYPEPKAVPTSRTVRNIRDSFPDGTGFARDRNV